MLFYFNINDFFVFGLSHISNEENQVQEHDSINTHSNEKSSLKSPTPTKLDKDINTDTNSNVLPYTYNTRSNSSLVLFSIVSN